MISIQEIIKAVKDLQARVAILEAPKPVLPLIKKTQEQKPERARKEDGKSWRI